MPEDARISHTIGISWILMHILNTLHDLEFLVLDAQTDIRVHSADIRKLSRCHHLHTLPWVNADIARHAPYISRHWR